MILTLLLLAAQDWPSWRYDAARTSSSPHALPEELRAEWRLELPPRRPAWPDQPRMQIDAVYEPVVAGRKLIVPSMEIDGVVAYDTRRGVELWRCWADGPVRFPAVIAEGRVYFASDDGYLYCVALETGVLQWRFRGGPSDRLVLGNERLISTWPARGAPVVANGRVTFAAGIWPFMGIFIHTLDAKTGRALWTTDGDGSVYMQQPHNTDSFAGVAPQGPLALLGDKLLIPGGRSVPALYEAKNGKLVHFKFADNGRRGGADVVAAGDVYFAAGAAFDAATGLFVADYARELVVTRDRFYHAGKKKDLISAAPPASTIVEAPDRKGVLVKKKTWKTGRSESAESPLITCLIKAGPRLYAGVDGAVRVYSEGERPRLLAEHAVEGTPASLLAADGRLFVVTREGWIHAFSGEAREPRVLARRATPEIPDRAGYEVLYSKAPAAELVPRIGKSAHHVIVVHPDETVVAELRRLLPDYGRAGVALRGTPESTQLPSYLASQVELPGATPSPDLLARVYGILRPHGGRLLLPGGGEDLDRRAAGLDGVKVAELNGVPCLLRPGAPAGAADWTHENADAANTRVSRDKRVRAPLGLLWFGGPSHEGILPRHGHGPQPQVLEGRLFIEGVDKLRAIDIYTGRLLWETSLPGVGDFFNNTAHQPGANATGSNFVSTPQGIFIAWKDRCVRLDPESGRILREYRLPDGRGDWGGITFVDGVLIGGAEPLNDVVVNRMTEGGFDDPLAGTTAEKEKNPLIKKLSSFRGDNDSFSSSRRLVGLDPDSGRVLWTVQARAGFRHHTLCAGGGRLYVIDRHSGPQADRLKKKGMRDPLPPRLLAFDVKDGRELWRIEDGVFGTWLSYSAGRDMLIEAGRVARDSLVDEPKGMIARQGATGAQVWWKKSNSGPAMIHGDTIFMADRACDLLTGQPRGRLHPLTLLPVEWIYARTYGCNTPMVSEHLLTFRSGAAGFFDLAGDGGTGNLGGFRSSCTNNLVVAGGVLCAPDYTRTCICSYQNQTSLALVPMPENEMWTFFGSSELKGAVRRIGVNFGAPGDRRDPDGTLWLEYPSAGGKSPQAPVLIGGDKLEYFRRHSSVASGEGPSWVSSSGAKGVREVVLTLDKNAKEDRDCRVRLHFIEPDGLAPGARVFDVSIQGETVLENFDPAREGGGPWRATVREFGPLPIGKELKVKFKARSGTPILCGIEVLPADAELLLKPESPERIVVAESARPVSSPDSDADDDRPFRWPPGLEAFLLVLLGTLSFYLLFTRLRVRRAA